MNQQMKRRSLKPPQNIQRQTGAAVVAALLIVALAVSLVAGLLWQEHVQIRALENIRNSSQIVWTQRLALDMSRLLLVDDLRNTRNDNLTEIWALPIAETKLSDFLSQSGQSQSQEALEGIPDTFLSGRIIDTQSRFNLLNLVVSSNAAGSTSLNNQYFIATGVSSTDIAAYQRLLSALGLPPQLAVDTANYIYASLATADTNKGELTVQGKPLQRIEDLLQISGYDVATLAKLKDYIVILPQQTTVNVNTARPEVINAVVPQLTLSVAQEIYQTAQRSAFTSVANLQTLPNFAALKADTSKLSVNSDYFLVYGLIRQGAAERLQVALVERANQINTRLPATRTISRVLWVHPIDTLPQNSS